MYTFTIVQLAWFLLFCLAVGVGVLLVMALVKLNNFLKNINKTYELNNENINKTLSALPETVENINDIAVTVKENVDKAGSALGILSGTTTETGENSSTLITYLKLIVDGILYVKNTFFSSEK